MLGIITHEDAQDAPEPMVKLILKELFHIMAKPIGLICNLDCTYGFYLKKEALFPDHDKAADFRINDQTPEKYVRQYIASQAASEISFAWQGGEPGFNYLCAGYKHFLHHIGPYMQMMATLLSNDFPAAQIMHIVAAQPGPVKVPPGAADHKKKQSNAFVR
jgi:sulfatase maturation enzyme AslB (radical SAM superfamily)